MSGLTSVQLLLCFLFKGDGVAMLVVAALTVLLCEVALMIFEVGHSSSKSEHHGEGLRVHLVEQASLPDMLRI
jgi:hypothetical protein